MKQCNTAYQLTNCLIFILLINAIQPLPVVCKPWLCLASVLEYHRDYDTELSEFPDDQVNELLPHSMPKSKITVLCDVHFIQCRAYITMYVMPL